MATRNWKKVTANSLRHAMELCLAHARERKNLSVDRVADLMGLPNKWTLYKWLENGRMPSVLIRPFEHACGITLMTRYLATSGGQLVIDIPAGKRADASDINAVQGSFSDAMGLLIKFYDGQTEAEETLGALTRLMSGIAWHRENVNKSLTPELELFGGEND
ncbi:helix-turn-helix domain-containing protein [Shewanella sp. KCT]|uniref:helix-turn-helix domain-containing protein n=1 Tax=Shewanella sp. KCT TaxID=2569535 RepID=UPI001182885F|nr:helix-turn-helix transcriptional regulator [Shewanella sp. KCT]TVP10573.1 hypothetical protein AYI87_17580 [Shewanella sp. KCT]